MHANSNAIRTAFMFLLVLSIGTSPALAQRGHGRGPGPVPHVKTATQGRGPAAKPPHPTTPAAKKGPTTPKASPKPNTPTKPNTPLTPQDHLIAQPKLAAKLQALIPGTPVNLAAEGFRNFGQFVAAVHVSHNLGIPFADLKARMTGPNPQSLGQSIHALRPTVNADAEANFAEQQARRDLQSR